MPIGVKVALEPDAEPTGGTGLLRILGLAFGLAVLVGNTIGMGILRTPGEVAERLPATGPFMAVWVLGACYALAGALTVSELSAMRPRSGGLFPLVHDGLGPFAGFICGWTDWLSTCGSTAAVAMVLGEYAGPLIGVPAARAAAIAVVVIIGFAVLQSRGVRVGDVAQQLMSLLKAIALLGLALVALVMSATGPAGPTAAPAASLPAGAALAAAVIVALQSAIYTYDGWTGPIYFGEEVQDAGRNVPRAMIGGVLLVLLIYLTLNLAFVRVLPVAEMAGDPFVAATVAKRLFGPSGDTILRVIMIVSLLASVNALQLIASRVPHALSRHVRLPRAVGHVSAGGTPVGSLFLCTAIAVGFVVTNTFDTVLALLAFMFVANYVLTFTSLFMLRRRAPERPRPFRTPGYPWIPGLALLGSIAFLIGALVTDTANSLIAIGLLVVSWPVYLAVRRRA